MNKRSLDALEYCLQALEDGADLQAVLARYPDLADELRPLLVTASQARAMAVPVPEASQQAMRLGRQRLMQRAAQMRPAARPALMPRLQRFAFSLGLALIFLMSGTGLVRASSSTLPGDELYPVKRTWEDVRLLFVFTPGHREALEGEYDQERLQEVSQVLQKGRVVPITFTGLITAQQDGLITVSGVPVAITNQTQFSGTQAILGASVIISGETDLQGQVTAAYVQVLPPGSIVPLGDDSSLPSIIVPPGTPMPGVTPPAQNPQPEQDTHDARSEFHLEGTIQSMQPDSLLIDGRTIYLEGTQLEGTLALGVQVEVEGYYTGDGRFIASKVEVHQEELQDSQQQEDEHDSSSGDSHEGEADHSDSEQPESDSSGN
jgi:hypothetical protein